jgi:hypothetical protein
LLLLQLLLLVIVILLKFDFTAAPDDLRNNKAKLTRRYSTKPAPAQLSGILEKTNEEGETKVGDSEEVQEILGTLNLAKLAQEANTSTLATLWGAVDEEEKNEDQIVKDVDSPTVNNIKILCFQAYLPLTLVQLMLCKLKITWFVAHVKLAKG